jgi:hypothetical protein
MIKSLNGFLPAVFPHLSALERYRKYSRNAEMSIHMKMTIVVTTVFDIMILTHVFVMHSAAIYVARREDWDRVFQ